MLSSSFSATLKSIFFEFFLMYSSFFSLQFIFQWFFSQCLQSFLENLKNDSSRRFFAKIADWQNDLKFDFFDLIKASVFDNLSSNLFIRFVERFSVVEKLRLFHLDLNDFFFAKRFYFSNFQIFFATVSFCRILRSKFFKISSFWRIDVIKISLASRFFQK